VSMASGSAPWSLCPLAEHNDSPGYRSLAFEPRTPGFLLICWAVKGVFLEGRGKMIASARLHSQRWPLAHGPPTPETPAELITHIGSEPPDPMN
jgi:hypothetical protein